MQSNLFRCLSLVLVLLGTLSCSKAAPSMDKPTDAQPEHLVRVYPINAELYEKLMKLTNDDNLISEARLTRAGLTAVRNTLDSGWNSLLRIIGLTTTVRAGEPKIDIDGQPLCVMQRSFSAEKEVESEPRQLQGRAAPESTNDSLISCIVVLKKDQDEPVSSAHPNFAPYWYDDNSGHAQPPPATDKMPPNPMPQYAMPNVQSKPAVRVSSHSSKNKISTRNRSKAQRRPHTQIRSQKNKNHGKTFVLDTTNSRQYFTYTPTASYGSPYGSLYGSPYGSSYGSSYGSPYGSSWASPYGSLYVAGYPVASYGQSNYAGYSPYPVYGPPSPFGDKDDSDEDEDDTEDEAEDKYVRASSEEEFDSDYYE